MRRGSLWSTQNGGGPVHENVAGQSQDTEKVARERARPDPRQHVDRNVGTTPGAIDAVTRPTDSRITEFQAEVARAFFSLPESDGFFVAGGVALIAHGIVDRHTNDVDVFTFLGDVRRAADALANEARRRGWRADADERGNDHFARLTLFGEGESTQVELAKDSPPLNALLVTFLGPTIDGGPPYE